MIAASGDPCPCEGDSPEGAPGPVEDDEAVIRFVPYWNWLLRNGAGDLVLDQAAFPQQELEGKLGKSVSVLRSMTDPPEIARRAIHRNREPKWADDPVAARGGVRPMRHLHDNAGRREICVNADPISDVLGHCPTHASILRATPPLDRDQRLHWAKLRLALASAFTDIAHVSGSLVSGLG